jgi:hypothetical protein
MESDSALLGIVPSHDRYQFRNPCKAEVAFAFHFPIRQNHSQPF